MIDEEVSEESKPSFEAFVAAERDRLRRQLHQWAARGLTSQEVDDIAQEALAGLYLCYKDVASAESAYAFVVTAARHRVIDAFRRARKRDDIAWKSSVHLHYSREPLDPLAVVIDADRSSVIRRALQGLPASQRRAVELVDMAALTPAEAASTMGVSRDRVKGFLQRGRARLRHELPSDVRTAPALNALGAAICRRNWRTALAGAPVLAAVGAFCLTVVHSPVVVPRRLPYSAYAAAEQAVVDAQRPIRKSVVHAVERVVLAVSPSSVGSAPAAPRRQSIVSAPIPAMACAGKTCLGGMSDGDHVCLADEQGRPVACANQSVIAVCERMPDAPSMPIERRVTCEREGDPEWVVPDTP